jgi:hypothetical protein
MTVIRIKILFCYKKKYLRKYIKHLYPLRQLFISHHIFLKQKSFFNMLEDNLVLDKKPNLKYLSKLFE